MNKKTLAIIIVVALLVVIGIFAATRNKGEDIKVGANFELTGLVAQYGVGALNGLKLAIEEANASGDLPGKIVLVEVDNRSDAVETANMGRKLIEQDKVVAVVGPVTSGNAKAMGPVAQEYKIPMITPTATAVDVTTIGEYVFRACFVDDFQGTAMGDFAYNKLGSRKAAVLYAKNDYAEGLAKYFKEKFTSLGGRIVAEEAFMDGDQDFKAQLTKIKAANPDMIYVPGYYNEQAYITKQARGMGINVPLTGGDGWDSLQEIIDIAGKENVTNIFYTNHYSQADPDERVQQFVAKYKETYNDDPSALAALGYEAGIILADAIKRAGDPTPENIRKAIAETKDLKTLASKITFDENRNPSKTLVVLEFKDGEQLFRDSVEP